MYEKNHIMSMSAYQMNGGNDIGIPASIPAGMTSPIEEAARDLGKSIEWLHEQIAALRQRVQLVSAPQANDAMAKGSTGGAQTQELPKSPLEFQLDSLRAGVESASYQISNITSYLKT